MLRTHMLEKKGEIGTMFFHDSRDGIWDAINVRTSNFGEQCFNSGVISTPARELGVVPRNLFKDSAGDNVLGTRAMGCIVYSSQYKVHLRRNTSFGGFSQVNKFEKVFMSFPFGIFLIVPEVVVLRSRFRQPTGFRGGDNLCGFGLRGFDFCRTRLSRCFFFGWQESLWDASIKGSGNKFLWRRPRCRGCDLNVTQSTSELANEPSVRGVIIVVGDALPLEVEFVERQFVEYGNKCFLGNAKPVPDGCWLG